MRRKREVKAVAGSRAKGVIRTEGERLPEPPRTRRERLRAIAAGKAKR